MIEVVPPLATSKGEPGQAPLTQLPPTIVQRVITARERTSTIQESNITQIKDALTALVAVLDHWLASVPDTKQSNQRSQIQKQSETISKKD